jgi:catechol 2,3-dioxygenase-like lactoylglutathione lyase family enzyme
MISGVGSVAVLVNDAKKSAEWFRDKLGFEILASEGHAVFIRPKGSDEPLIHLCAGCDDWGDDKPGGHTGIWFRCGEIEIWKDEKTGRFLPASDPFEVEKTYLDLQKKGVEFSQPLRTTDWGKAAMFKDLDGNEFEIS